MGISSLKSWHFEASEDIITKFKSQGLYFIRIKYWNASGSGFPPFLIPALQNIGILHHKKAKLPKHLQHSVYSTCKLKIGKILLRINLLILDVDIKDVQDELKKQGVRYL